MAGEQKIIRDLTTGSVPGTLLRFSMPLFFSGLLQMVYNMVEMVVVGRFVGTGGLSAVAIGGEVLQLITFVAMGFSNAGQILISRYVGEDERDKVGKMVGTLFTLLGGLAVVITVVFLFSYRGILHWLNTPEDIWEYTRQYSVTCVYGTFFIYGYNLVSAILRGMGDSRHPFQFIAIASVINIVLDVLFVGPMGMGPLGAALATVIGQAVSFLFALRLLY
ncbi:MAG: polysaccharide biosynthesis C-terminal domain-containing protein, partial [Clostridia bacterium]|nr:polysaccharide biosynthesis C-terminal domain-containing protein [Clostridia bacterium]